MKYTYSNLVFREGTEKGRDREIDVFHEGVRIAVIEEQASSYRDWIYIAYDYRNREYRFGERCYSANTVVEAKKGLLDYLNENQVDEEYSCNVKALPAEDVEFYPTPKFIAGKMLAKIRDIRDIVSILEPSAGKGDILDCLNSMFESDNHRFPFESKKAVKAITDVIEIDPNLQFILQGKGYRLVSDDFLTFHTNKHYDLILMNPPFSNGDEHLLKAIQMIERTGGQVICLLNAETLRNPYTMRRQVLLNAISKYEGSVEYFKNAFKKAQRRTDVEVAIVSIYIPKKRCSSRFYDELKKAHQSEYEHFEATELATGTWFEQMTKNFEIESNAGINFLKEYDALTPYIMTGKEKYDKPIIQLRINDHNCNTVDSSVINKYLECLRLRYWKEFLSRPELTERMTSVMADEYNDTIQRMKDYDFNLFNVRKVLLEIQGQLNEGVEDAIIALFDKLSAEHAWYPECENNRHYYNGWSTNKAHKIGKKCIIPANGCYAEKNWRHKECELKTYEIYKIISDLEKALDFLNFGAVVFRCPIDLAVSRANDEGKNIASFTYFDVRFYKKGTAHITFHDDAMILLDRLNIFAGKHKNWLPPFYGKVKYDDLDSKSKDVIDSFQERDEYEKICRNYSSYVIEAKGKNVLELMN